MKIYLRNIGNSTNYRAAIKEKKEADFYPEQEGDKEASNDEKLKCDYFVYIFTPSFNDLFAVAEVIDDAIKYPDKTLFCFFDDEKEGKGFSKHQVKSLKAVAKMVASNKGRTFESIDSLIEAI